MADNKKMSVEDILKACRTSGDDEGAADSAAESPAAESPAACAAEGQGWGGEGMGAQSGEGVQEAAGR